MKKNIIQITAGLVLAAGLFFGGRSLYYEYYPLPIKPSADWEPYVSQLDAQRETYLSEVDGVSLEAELFIPHNGEKLKSAVVFSPGSGDSLYQNYAPGFIETYVLDLFLARDMAVLLVNKRGMGESEGLYTASSIEGRGDDLSAIVADLQSHPGIDPDNIGLIGHSEGGWVAVYAAAQNPEVAFFVSLAGPTTTRRDQASDMYTFEAICSGLEGEEYDEYLEKRNRMTDLGVRIGKLTNFGLLGFDYRSMSFDPRDSLIKVQNPGLYIFGENDILVPPEVNIERLEGIFGGGVPDRLTVVTAADATHIYRVVDEPCDSFTDPTQHELSSEVAEILNDWLEDQGY